MLYDCIWQNSNAGDEIPERFYDLLEYDLYFCLQENEWVGYEAKEEDEENEAVYVCAKIIEQTVQGIVLFVV